MLQGVFLKDSSRSFGRTNWNTVRLDQPVVLSASQEDPRLLWIPNVHYRVLNQMNYAHTLKSCSFNINFNINSLSVPGC
jgi:hypothetical protein